MKTIREQFAVFRTKATQSGTVVPAMKEGALEVGFYAGFVAALKTCTDLSHDLSDLETERQYEALRQEMAAFFDPENIKRFYAKAKGKRAQGN